MENPSSAITADTATHVRHHGGPPNLYLVLLAFSRGERKWMEMRMIQQVKTWPRPLKTLDCVCYVRPEWNGCQTILEVFKASSLLKLGVIDYIWRLIVNQTFCMPVATRPTESVVSPQEGLTIYFSTKKMPKPSSVRKHLNSYLVP